jgi:hypothetical protein
MISTVLYHPNPHRRSRSKLLLYLNKKRIWKLRFAHGKRRLTAATDCTGPTALSTQLFHSPPRAHSAHSPVPPVTAFESRLTGGDSRTGRGTCVLHRGGKPDSLYRIVGACLGAGVRRRRIQGSGR